MPADPAAIALKTHTLTLAQGGPAPLQAPLILVSPHQATQLALAVQGMTKELLNERQEQLGQEPRYQREDRPEPAGEVDSG